MIEDPRRAPAEVLAARETSQSVPDPFGRASVIWKLRLRVRPAAERAFEVSVKQPYESLGAPLVGSLVGVRYDAGDHAKLVIETGAAPRSSEAGQATAVQPQYPLRSVMRGARIAVFGSSADNKIERDSSSRDSQSITPPPRPTPSTGDPPESALGKQIDAVQGSAPVQQQAAAMLDATVLLRAPLQDPAAKLKMLTQVRDRGDLTEAEFEAFKRHVLDS